MHLPLCVCVSVCLSVFISGSISIYPFLFDFSPCVCVCVCVCFLIFYVENSVEAANQTLKHFPPSPTDFQWYTKSDITIGPKTRRTDGTHLCLHDEIIPIGCVLPPCEWLVNDLKQNHVTWGWPFDLTEHFSSIFSLFLSLSFFFLLFVLSIICFLFGFFFPSSLYLNFFMTNNFLYFVLAKNFFFLSVWTRMVCTL